MRPTLALFAVALSTACQSLRTESHPEAGAWVDKLVEPITAPVTFESPTIETSVRPIYARHEFPKSSIFGGGNLSILAVQARAAITDRLAVIATKDGYFDLDPKVGQEEKGAGDIAGGLKYAFVEDHEKGNIVTGGLIYESESGDKKVLQGNGDGVLRPFVSAGFVRNVMSYTGSLAYNQPLDTSAESSSLDWHAQAAWRGLNPKFALSAEVNGILYTKDGNALPVDFEGGDVINLGASQVSGHNLITGALGFRWNIFAHAWLGFAYEVPITSRKDVFENRLTADLLVVF